MAERLRGAADVIAASGLTVIPPETAVDVPASDEAVAGPMHEGLAETLPPYLPIDPVTSAKLAARMGRFAQAPVMPDVDLAGVLGVSLLDVREIVADCRRPSTRSLISARPGH